MNVRFNAEQMASLSWRRRAVWREASAPAVAASLEWKLWRCRTSRVRVSSRLSAVRHVGQQACSGGTGICFRASVAG